SADNAQAIFRQDDPYLVQGIDWGTGTTGVGNKVNAAIGIGLMIQAPSPYGWGRPLDPQPLFPETPLTAQQLVTSEVTPVNPIATGLMINIYGEGETAGFSDYATEPQ